MSDSDGGKSAALRGISVGVGLLLAVIVVGLSGSLVLDIYERREVAQERSQADCADRENCGPESLQADIRAAIAAEDVVDIGVIQTLIGVTGLIFIGLTLKATLDAVREASAATEAARNAVKLTEDHGRRQLRAYVTVEIGSLKPLEAGKVPTASVTIANGGQTPAFNVSTRYVVELLGENDNITVISMDMVSRVQLIIGSKYDKANTVVAPFSLTKAGLQDIKEGKAAIVLSGCTVYEDTFGNTWWTQFCHLYKGPEMKGAYHPGLNRGT
jgi:hypothetical protein